MGAPTLEGPLDLCGERWSRATAGVPTHGGWSYGGSRPSPRDRSITREVSLSRDKSCGHPTSPKWPALTFPGTAQTHVRKPEWVSPGWLCLRQRRVPGSNLGGGADKATLKGAHPATVEGGRNVKVNRCKERPRTAQGKEPGERRVLSGAGLPHGKGVLAGGGAVG